MDGFQPAKVIETTKKDRKRVHQSRAQGAKKKPACQTAKKTPLSFYEFFAGGGMARAGLGPRWKCLFSNDFDFKKSATYVANWGDNTLVTKDVGLLLPEELPGKASLVWASFPCQDLSLAGMGAGLRGNRSGTFWPFWKLVEKLKDDGREPRVIVLENVYGTLTSHGGKDFSSIADALFSAKYRFGAVILNAAEFVPHSRPRLFIIAVADSASIPDSLLDEDPSDLRHPKAIKLAYSRLSKEVQDNWIWWRVPQSSQKVLRLIDILEENPDSVKWHTPEETTRLLSMMNSKNREKVLTAKRFGKKIVGTIYKRTRRDETGEKVQRAEVRFDDVAGCLRTPAGGSSRQLIIVVEGENVRSRFISSRETARLMGLSDDYKLPPNYNEAYHLTGDGVVVPVVRHLAETLLEPLIQS